MIKKVSKKILSKVATTLGCDLVEKASGTACEQAEVPQKPASSAEGIYTPVFDYDGLRNDPRVIHNHDFMKDPRFLKAYGRAHEALAEDHPMFWRLHVALWCAAQAQHLPGDFVECGVWRGFLATAIMNYIPWPQADKQFYLFDTWEGLDERYLTEGERGNQQKLDHFKPYYANQFEDVKKHFSTYANVQLIKGAIPETLDQCDIPEVSFLSIDMNCALPELAAAEYFWDRMVPGGMILLDDYGFVSYEDQKRGFDEFASAKGIEILALPTGQGLMIKNRAGSRTRTCKGRLRMTVEPQYEHHVDLKQKQGLTPLGVEKSANWHTDPKRLAFVLSRYKFVAKMLSGMKRVLEIGCGDGWPIRMVLQEVESVHGIDIDPVFIEDIKERMDESWPFTFEVHDILEGPLTPPYDAAYSLDVLEHIRKEDERKFMDHLVASLTEKGVAIIGMPSLSSQQHASKLSKIGHVNCKDAPELKRLMLDYFDHAFIFSMNDEVVHTGYHPMAQYLFALCTGVRKL